MGLKANRYIRPSAQSLVAFSMSSCIHLLACLVLALILITGNGHFGQSLQLAIDSNEESQALTQLDLNLDSPEESLVSGEARVSWSAMSNSMSTAISTDVSLPTAPFDSSMGSDGPFSSVVADLEQATNSRASEASESKTDKSKTGASFFGAQAEGNRFVFVIDSSGSMRGPRWESLCKELVRAIKSLSPDQDFFVISFDAFAHPMFGTAPPKGKFLKSIDKNVKRIQNWLLSIEHGRNTLPASSVGMAMKLEPDAIFLLSDGEIRDSTVMDLRVWNRKQDEDGSTKALVPIHTVLLHSLMGYETLETIARENGGTFTPVKPH